MQSDEKNKAGITDGVDRADRDAGEIISVGVVTDLDSAGLDLPGFIRVQTHGVDVDVYRRLFVRIERALESLFRTASGGVATELQEKLEKSVDALRSVGMLTVLAHVPTNLSYEGLVSGLDKFSLHGLHVDLDTRVLEQLCEKPPKLQCKGELKLTELKQHPQPQHEPFYANIGRSKKGKKGYKRW